MALYAFDGTWNDAKDAGQYGLHTNVVEFFLRYNGVKHIYSGVGTRHGLIVKIFGGAFGAGGKSRVKKALCDLRESSDRGDHEIDIVGFSRGAAIAIDFANNLSAAGRSVRFLGLFDLVASFGIPIDVGIKFQSINLGYRLSMPKGVNRCYHALALDERRPYFRPTRVKWATETWFRGGHSDIGGGNNNCGLSNITLRWMIFHARACSLPIARVGYGDLPCDPRAEPILIRPIARGSRRQLEQGDRIHYSAMLCGVQVPPGVKIDGLPRIDP